MVLAERVWGQGLGQQCGFNQSWTIADCFAFTDEKTAATSSYTIYYSKEDVPSDQPNKPELAL